MKKLFSILLALAMVLSLVACGSKEQTPDDGGNTPSQDETPTNSDAKYLVGVNMGSIDQSYYAYLRMGMENERRDDVDLFVTYHEWDLTTQIKQIEDFITMGCDLIVMVAADPDGVLPAMNAAKDAGIPIIEMDCPTNYFPEYSIGQFVSDDYDAGYQVGKAMAEGMNGEGVVQSYVITATVNSQKRLAGFCDAIAEYPNIDNIYNATEKFDATTAQTIIENMPTPRRPACSPPMIRSPALRSTSSKRITLPRLSSDMLRLVPGIRFTLGSTKAGTMRLTIRILLTWARLL